MSYVNSAVDCARMNNMESDCNGGALKWGFWCAVAWIVVLVWWLL